MLNGSLAEIRKRSWINNKEFADDPYAPGVNPEIEVNNFRPASALGADTYEVLFTHIPDQVVVLDRKGNIVEVSPSVCMELGYSQDEILNMRYSDVAASGVAKTPAGLFAKNINDRPVTFKTAYVCKNGATKSVEVSCRAISCHSKKFFLTVARGITEQEKRETGVEKAYAEMQTLEQVRSQYLAGIVHDLKTPLTAVKGFVDMLLSGKAGPLTAKQDKFLRSCSMAISREAELIECLENYSRAKTGRPVINKGEVDISDVLRKSLAWLEPLAELKNIIMETEIEHGPMIIQGDAHQLSRVFNNLFSNAVKYNQPGGSVKIEVRAYGLEKVCISVKDTGIGIPSEEQGKVFERYYRAKSSHSTKIPGMGIGLAVVREIIQLHDGEIFVDSEPGRGSTFYTIFKLLPPPQ
ncbi:MAG: PAS domain-containing sensor histidine kinase [Deltaproteobacteria bacterium]|nr:PAS domain-containing sensor histidine kinase [Deltaproteobacteria bacterium]